MLGGVQKQQILDKSTWTLATINALILLSSFSFTGTLVILILKSLKTQGAAPATNTPFPAKTPATTIQQINFKYILKCQPVKAGIFIRNYVSLIRWFLKLL
jgi:hypothetical protein